MNRKVFVLIWKSLHRPEICARFCTTACRLASCAMVSSEIRHERHERPFDAMDRRDLPTAILRNETTLTGSESS